MKMSLKFPTIGKNNLFTPSLILILVLASYLFSNTSFLTPETSATRVVGIGLIVMILKVFTITYGNLELSLKSGKWLYIALNCLLAGFQFILIFSTFDQLTKTAYLLEAVFYMGLSNLLFLIQMFFAKVKGVLTFSILAGLVYLAFYLFLFQQYINDIPTLIRYNINFFMAWPILFIELVFFLLVCRRFVTRK